MKNYFNKYVVRRHLKVGRVWEIRMSKGTLFQILSVRQVKKLTLWSPVGMKTNLSLCRSLVSDSDSLHMQFHYHTISLHIHCQALDRYLRRCNDVRTTKKRRSEKLKLQPV